MVWSLLNHMIAEKVKALLDEQQDQYPPDVKRFYSREQAEAIIHAALWGYSAREDSTAGCYASTNMFQALGLKWWTFDDGDAEAHRALAQNLRLAKYAAEKITSEIE